MSPMVDVGMKEEIDGKPLTLPVSPLSEDDNIDPSSDHLSNSFPLCSLSRALHDVHPDDVKPGDVKLDSLSMSCLADLKLDTFADDDDLTSLDWLQDINLLRNICLESAHKENTLMSTYHSKHNPYGKPPYSFSVLIFMAIESSPHHRMPVKGIYEWIAEHFPFYRRAPLGWRNSVRHNLSLNRCFKKVEKAVGKGSSWCIDPLFRPNLLQAMKRTPYFPFQQVQMTSLVAAEVFQDACIEFEDVYDEECETSPVEQLSHLLPFRSRRRQHAKASEVDMDVANTLASLGNARSSTRLSDRELKLLKIRSVENLPQLVCTPPASNDHSYGFAECLVVEAQQTALAVTCDVESPVDEVYDFGEIYCDSEVSSLGSCEVLSDGDSHCSRSSLRRRVTSRRSWMKPDPDVVDDEEQKRLEGVRALLNLASATKVDRARKPASGSIWVKAVSKQLKKQRKRKRRIGKVEKNELSKSIRKNKKKVTRRRR